MHSKLKRTLTAILAAALLITLWVPALAAEQTDPDDAQGEEETAAPQTAEPEETATPAPQTPAPATPPPATIAPAMPQPTEAPGSVNLHLYLYTTDDTPAAGYTVSMGDARATTTSSGLADFANLPVAQQQVRIVSPSGDTSVGRLYMSRSSATGITDQAMGGTYGVDVARGLGELYMLATFVPGDAIDIRTVSATQPALPTPPPSAPTETPAAQTASASATDTIYQVKALTATFVDGEGKAISGMQVAVTGADGTTAALTTSSAGAVNVPNAPYGLYTVSAALPGGDTASFNLAVNPGIRTAIVQGTSPDIVVEAATTADHLYLQFTQTAAGFMLSEASDTPIGSDMTSLVVGIIVVVAAVVAVMVTIVVLRKRKETRRHNTATVPVRPQRKVNYDPNQASAQQDAQPRRTGGANKFDDRSKM